MISETRCIKILQRSNTDDSLNIKNRNQLATGSRAINSWRNDNCKILLPPLVERKAMSSLNQVCLNAKDNDADLMKMSNWFSNKFTECLNNINLTEAASMGEINNTILDLGKILEEIKPSTFMNGILCNLHDAILDPHSTGEKKIRALSIIRKLADSRYLGDNPEILIQIVNTAEKLLSHNHWYVSNNAVMTITSLAAVGVLTMVEVAVIESLLMKAVLLIDYKQAILMIKALLKTQVIQSVKAKVIEHILVNLKELLSHKEGDVRQIALATIKVLAQIGVLKEVQADIIKSVLIEVEELLNQKKYKIVHEAIATINALAHNGLLRGFELKAIELILLHQEAFFDHANHILASKTVIQLLQLLSKVAKTELFKEIESNILDNIIIQVEQLLIHAASAASNRIGIAIHVFVTFAKTDLLREIAPLVIDKIIIQIKSLLNHKDEVLVTIIIQAISLLAQTDFLKKKFLM